LSKRSRAVKPGDSAAFGVNTFKIVSPSNRSSNAEVLFPLYVDIGAGNITFTP
jgi:hypothetical protein